MKKPRLELRAPGDLLLMRSDTKRPKAMGWARFGLESSLFIHIDLKTKPPNESFRGTTARAAMGTRARNKACREWTISALSQCAGADEDCTKWGRPSRATITRISSGTMDDDGLVGALKHVRDGIALAIGFNDREFSIAGERAGAIPLFYRQATPGKRGVFGVRIQLEW